MRGETKDKRRKTKDEEMKRWRDEKMKGRSPVVCLPEAEAFLLGEEIHLTLKLSAPLF